jgi:hypothetical protein
VGTEGRCAVWMQLIVCWEGILSNVGYTKSRDKWLM